MRAARLWRQGFEVLISNRILPVVSHKMTLITYCDHGILRRKQLYAVFAICSTFIPLHIGRSSTQVYIMIYMYNICTYNIIAINAPHQCCETARHHWWDMEMPLVGYGNAMVVTRIGASGHMVKSRTVTSSRNRDRSAPLLPRSIPRSNQRCIIYQTTNGAT